MVVVDKATSVEKLDELLEELAVVVVEEVDLHALKP